jgi:hypothetical protein
LSQAPSSAGEPHTLLNVMLCLVADAKAIDIRAWEEAELARLRLELPAQVAELLARGVQLFGELLGPAEEEELTEHLAGGRLGSVHRLAVRGALAERLSDVTFVARGELRTRLAVLLRLVKAEDRWLIVSLADGGLRKLIKALTAVEALLAESELRPPAISSASDLQTSLAVRRAYTKFRQRIECTGPEGKDGARAALRSAATSIAGLIGLDVYGSLRIQDRVELRRLQERILAWHSRPPEAESGLQLWQEVLNVAHLFVTVNHRPELCEHDREILAELREQLRRCAPLSPVPAALRASAARIAGRDDDLDTLLGQPEPVSTYELLKHLEVIARRLDHPSAESRSRFDSFPSHAGGAGMAPLYAKRTP